MTAHTRPQYLARFTHAAFECVRWTQSRGQRTITGYRLLRESLEPFSPQTASRLTNILVDLQYDKAKHSLILIVPHQRVTAQYLRLPSSSADEISSMVSLQAVKLFPSGEGLIAAGRIIRIESGGSATVNAVLVQDEVITSYIDLLSGAGAVVDDVFLDVYNFEGYFSKPIENNGVSLLIHIEDDACQAAMIREGRICVSRGFFVNRSSAQWQDKLLFQVLETQGMYFKTDSSAAVKRVILAVPDPVQRKEYLEFFREQLPQEVRALSLERARAVSCQADVPGFPEKLMGPLGFIVSQPDPEVSLMPLTVRARRRQAIGTRRSFRVLACTALALLLFAAAALRYLSRKSAFLERVQQEIESLKKDIGPVEDMAAKLQAVRDLSDEKKVMLDFVTAVHQVAPSGMMIEDLQYDSKGPEPFSVYGFSAERESVFLFATQLSEFAIFGSQAQVKYADRVDTPDGELIKFKVAFTRGQQP